MNTRFLSICVLRDQEKTSRIENHRNVLKSDNIPSMSPEFCFISIILNKRRTDFIIMFRLSTSFCLGGSRWASMVRLKQTATIELPHSGKMMTNNFHAVARKEGSHGTPPHNLVNLSINLHNGRPDRPLGRARASLFIVHQKAHFSKFPELQSDGQ